MNNSIVKNEYFLQPGYMYITQESDTVYAVLGSCVMVCLHNRMTLFSGICLYKFPVITRPHKTTPQYGNAAINGLIKMMVRDGSKKTDMEAMLFGGADKNNIKGIGQQNVSIAKKILKRHKIRIVSEDVGGLKGRKVVYHTATNQAIIYKVNSIRDNDWHPYEGR